MNTPECSRDFVDSTDSDVPCQIARSKPCLNGIYLGGITWTMTGMHEVRAYAQNTFVERCVSCDSASGEAVIEMAGDGAVTSRLASAGLRVFITIDRARQLVDRLNIAKVRRGT